MRRLSRAKRRALVAAYSRDHAIAVYSAGEGGTRERTLRDLEAAGLLARGPDEDWEGAQITDAGRRALGLADSAPTDLGHALSEACEALLEYAVPAEAVELGHCSASVCLDEDADAWLDSGEVIAAIDLGEVEGGFVREDEEDEVAWGAVAARLEEAGWSVELERHGGYLILVRDP